MGRILNTHFGRVNYAKTLKWNRHTTKRETGTLSRECARRLKLIQKGAVREGHVPRNRTEQDAE